MDNSTALWLFSNNMAYPRKKNTIKRKTTVLVKKPFKKRPRKKIQEPIWHLFDLKNMFPFPFI